MHRVKARLLVAGLFVLQILCSPLMVLVARPPRGLAEGLFGSVLLALLTSGLATIGFWLADDPAGARSAAIVCAAALAGLVLCVGAATALARKCRFGGDAVGSHFREGDPNPDALGWADTEDDYVWLAALLVTRLDPRLPPAEAVAARDRVCELVTEVRSHPDYDHLARVWDVANRGMLCGRLDPHHCYTFRPEPRDPDERFGLLVFLHGHGSNYLVLLHSLRQLAEDHRLVVACPSFGYGNWEAPGGVAAVERARGMAEKLFPIDPGRVFLAGLLQGGAGVSRVGAAHGDAYAGLIFISGTLEPAVVGSPGFAAGWKGRPVLVIQGGRDTQVKPRTTEAAVGAMRAAGVNVTYHLEPESGHLLYFARHDDVRALVGKWLADVARRG